ncbi:MAG TPA: inositol monophosphatase family protein [Acidimicrobiales bacterium]|nr:inositol monophosphatase family protein [Acidimicrobiales bacterium]
MTDDEILAVLGEAAAAVAAALAATPDWGEAGTRPGQHLSDLAADEAAIGVLSAAGLSVFSEESGRTGADTDLTVVIDPVDGSTNASRGVSWWATSLCAIDDRGPRVALVDDLVHGTRATAIRGRGGEADGAPLAASGCTDLSAAIVGLNGLPARHLGWAQCRALGAAALDLGAVASGRLDAFVDCSGDGLAPWDYLGAALLCAEAGATVLALDERPLHDLGAPVRRPVVAAATAELAHELADRYRRAGPLPRLAP